MINPQPGHCYEIGTCSGETRRWRFLRVDDNGLEWWFDLDENREFNDTAIMYAWWVEAEVDAGPQA